MVRSSGHHRKRSLSRSLSPSDHKRVKSSHRDREKERSRRRSRSRDRTRRSRSRDRKSKDKRSSESRVHSKPLKFKRRSRSRSRSLSRSREHVVKKEEKKEVKADDEPFDPTNLDKPEFIEETCDDGEWIVTDMVQDPEDEEESVNENCVNSSIENNKTEKRFEENCSEDKVIENIKYKSEERPECECFCFSSHTEENKKNDDNCKMKSLNRRSNHSSKMKTFDSKSILEKLALQLEHAKEFHKLRIKHEIERHDFEIKLLQFQFNYWKEQCEKNVSTENISNQTSNVVSQTEEIKSSENKQSDNSIIITNTIENVSIESRSNLSSTVESQIEEVEGIKLTLENKQSENNTNKKISCDLMVTNQIIEVVTQAEKSEVN
uniref:Uncharacterized protein n=2 Tax=Clastoptera arizonana TaxID=38151 RepID=A0A1B6E9V3_9HEMI